MAKHFFRRFFRKTNQSRKHAAPTPAYTIKKKTTLTEEQLSQVSELYAVEATEEDKIQAMMKQGFFLFFRNY